nr:cytochrome c [Jeotgalicoccus sp. WY2]
MARDSCASCHGSDFSGGMGPALAGLSLSEDEFSEIVRNGQGSMPAFSEDQIKDEELSALYTFFSEQ